MDIQGRRQGPLRIFAIRGSADVSASAALREAILGAIEAGDTRIVCDLQGTDFIGSDALGVLITAYIKARSRGGFLRLAGPSPRLREVLETTRLDHLFEIFPDLECAVKTP